jgi:glycosyltransferase involved in cell wall biosynthesis
LKQPLEYSVVAPMHNEEGNIQALYLEIRRVMEQMKQPYEIVFVNDASLDTTLPKMKDIQSSEPNFHFVDLEYNVGENWALLAGISKARGDIIITIDGDYQNDPAYIPRLLEELSRGYRVVSGWRSERVGSFWSRRLPSWIANGLIRLVSRVSVHDCGCGLKAYRKEVLEGKFVPKGFMNRFSPVALGVKEHEFSEVEIVDRARKTGESHYGLSRIFVVLRDLWVLPFAIRGPERWLWRFRAIQTLGFATTLSLALSRRWLLSGTTLGLSILACANAAGLKQFINAQVDPHFRIREYR